MLDHLSVHRSMKHFKNISFTLKCDSAQAKSSILFNSKYLLFQSTQRYIKGILFNGSASTIVLGIMILKESYKLCKHATF